MKRLFCDVYKSLRHDEMYVYVSRQDGLSRVPDELIERCGRLDRALTFLLTEDRTLAKEDAKTVIANIEEHGYHLQLPPLREDRVAKLKAERERATRGERE